MALVHSRRYRSVLEMVMDTSSEEFSEEFEKSLKETAIIRHLTACRVAAGLTQAEVGKRVGCSGPHISKLESKKDDKVKVGILRKYAKAVGAKLNISVE